MCCIAWRSYLFGRVSVRARNILFPSLCLAIFGAALLAACGGAKPAASSAPAKRTT